MVILYAIALALAVAGLEWLEYRYVTRAFSTEIYIVLLAAVCVEETAKLESLRINYANPLFRIPMTFLEIFPVGLLVSLVSALLLRNPRLLPATR